MHSALKTGSSSVIATTPHISWCMPAARSIRAVLWTRACLDPAMEEIPIVLEMPQPLQWAREIRMLNGFGSKP